ncbi:hypothetical protein FGO68_gene7797 [Halteria grandinella]|uniref:Uncharacterized protein n=1 Tax=Halteria grandinella TaxID=5974 RepID=A0A8J8NPZ2_HALGN|nr:hypothetical protein FGO68_gene7797 [Halteria grandinella]
MAQTLLYQSIALASFLALSYQAFSLRGDPQEHMMLMNKEISEANQDSYDFLKRYLTLAETNKIVMPFRELERMKTTGGGDEDPYDKMHRELITEARTLK